MLLLNVFQIIQTSIINDEQELFLWLRIFALEYFTKLCMTDGLSNNDRTFFSDVLYSLGNLLIGLLFRHYPEISFRLVAIAVAGWLIRQCNLKCYYDFSGVIGLKGHRMPNDYSTPAGSHVCRYSECKMTARPRRGRTSFIWFHRFRSIIINFKFKCSLIN